MTQAKPDKMAGLIPTSVSKIENGKQTMSALKLISLAKTLKVKVIAFLDREFFFVMRKLRRFRLYILAF